MPKRTIRTCNTLKSCLHPASTKTTVRAQCSQWTRRRISIEVLKIILKNLKWKSGPRLRIKGMDRQISMPQLVVLITRASQCCVLPPKESTSQWLCRWGRERGVRSRRPSISWRESVCMRDYQFSMAYLRTASRMSLWVKCLLLLFWVNKIIIQWVLKQIRRLKKNNK